MGVSLLRGGSPETTGAYDNGIIDVPAKQSEVIAVDSGNVLPALIESGYYEAGDFTGLE